MRTKRVTITVEFVEYDGHVSWGHTETEELSTGDNPRFHLTDVRTALTVAENHTAKAISDRFGSVKL